MGLRTRLRNVFHRQSSFSKLSRQSIIDRGASPSPEPASITWLQDLSSELRSDPSVVELPEDYIPLAEPAQGGRQRQHGSSFSTRVPQEPAQERQSLRTCISSPEDKTLAPDIGPNNRVWKRDLEMTATTEPSPEDPLYSLPFYYMPLDDPRTMIRLLRFDKSSIKGQIDIQLEEFNLKDAPRYVALSYAWGSPSAGESIFVNNQAMLVQPSCRAALQLLRQHALSEWYWIDAICINQKDDMEKGPQVQMMAGIYGRASQVAVDYGVETKDSLWLTDQLHRRLIPGTLDNPEEFDATFLKWLDSEDSHYHSFDWRSCACKLDVYDPGNITDSCLVARIRGALHQIGTMRYWSRIWIRQELAKAQTIVVLHPTAWIPLRDMYLFALHFEAVCLAAVPLVLRHHQLGLPIGRICGWLYGTEKPFRLSTAIQKFDILELIETCMLAQCTVLLDKIYAVLSLVKWPPGQSVLPADYTIDTLELARRVLSATNRGLDTGTLACRMITYLHLRRPDSAALELVVERCKQNGACMLGCDPPNSITWPSGFPIVRDIVSSAWSCVLRETETQDLALPLVLRPVGSPRGGLARPRRFDTFGASWFSVYPYSKCCPERCRNAPAPKSLYHGDQVEGMVSGYAEAGDHVLKMSYLGRTDKTRNAFVVIRPSGDGFELIGYALLNYYDYKLEDSGSLEVSGITGKHFPSAILNFDVDDLLALAYLCGQVESDKEGLEESERDAMLLTSRICWVPGSSYVSLPSKN